MNRREFMSPFSPDARAGDPRQDDYEAQGIRLRLVRDQEKPSCEVLEHLVQNAMEGLIEL